MEKKLVYSVCEINKIIEKLKLIRYNIDYKNSIVEEDEVVVDLTGFDDIIGALHRFEDYLKQHPSYQKEFNENYL